MLTIVNKCVNFRYSITVKEVLTLGEKKLVIPAKKYIGETSVVSARLPIDLIKKIDEICEATGRNKNEIIQLCLEFSVDNIEIER